MKMKNKYEQFYFVFNFKCKFRFVKKKKMSKIQKPTKLEVKK